jgi:hypothetical protein
MKEYIEEFAVLRSEQGTRFFLSWASSYLLPRALFAWTMGRDLYQGKSRLSNKK